MKIYYENKLMTFKEFLNKFKFKLAEQSHDISDLSQFIHNTFKHTEQAMQAMLPVTPEEPKRPQEFEMRLKGISSLQIYYDESEPDSWEQVPNPSYESDLATYEKKFNEEYLPLHQKHLEKVNTVKNSKEYKQLENTMENIQQIRIAYERASKVPEWKDVYAMMMHALDAAKEKGSKRSELESLENKLEEINNSKTNDPDKIKQLIDATLEQYRKILRNDMTGLFSTETKSKLAEELQKFCANLRIGLPKSLQKGESLDIVSLETKRSINKDFYDLMTKTSGPDMSEKARKSINKE